jgi:hypothetical protein
MDYLDDVGELTHDLATVGLPPVLVGGMALVILGSRRVTRDFDFVIPPPGERLTALIDLLYGRGLELVSRLDRDGNPRSTIGNPRVAAVRLKLDAPSSAHFLNPATGLRVDLLFDYPVPAGELALEAARVKVRSHVLQIASDRDLLRLKKIARSSRGSPGDAEDIAFLEARLESRRE